MFKKYLIILFLFPAYYIAQNNQWVYFNKNNTPLISNRIMAIEEYNDNYYILTSRPFSFFRFNSSIGWTRLDTVGSIFSGSNLSYIYKDQFDRLWVFESDIFYLSEGKWEKIETDFDVSAIAVEDPNLIWLGTYYNGLYKYDFSSFTNFESEFLNYEINVIKIDTARNKWIGMDDGGELVITDGNNIEKISHPDFMNHPLIPLAYSVNGLSFDNDGLLWISAHPIGSPFSYKDNTIYNYANYNHKTKNWIIFDSSDVGLTTFTNKKSLQTDINNNKWDATTSGLMFYDNKDFTFYNSGNSGLPEDNVWNVFIDSYENKWCSGFPEYGIAIFNENGIQNITGISEGERNSKSFELYQNFPNPFNSVTTIKFYLPYFQKVEAYVYDLLGNKLAVISNEFMGAGEHKIVFDASNLASGIYIYQIKTDKFINSKKLILLK